MRLIGGKDYYDGVSGFDTDERRVFVRVQFEKAESRPKDKVYDLGESLYDFSVLPHGEKSYYYGDKKLDLGFKVVIFCGVIYTIAYRTESKFNYESGRHEEKFFGFTTGDAILTEMERQKFNLRDPSEKRWKRYGESDGVQYVTEKNIDDYLRPRPVPDKLLEILIAENVVHSIRSGLEHDYHERYTSSYPKWLDNTDGLKHVGFASIMDPWQAYQQIDMWLGSQLAKEEDNMVRLSDKELIAKHGFDKVSFRNTHHVGKPRGQK